MRTYYRDDNIGYHFHYKGLASRDQAQEYVIIELFREDVPHTYASFVLRTGVYNEQGQHVSIGHHSYFAFRWAKYLTKQVVLLRREQLPDLDFEPREIRREDAEYDQLIPLLIRRFLSNRDKNRLSMPGKLINRLEGGTYSLKNWFDDYFRGREPDPVWPEHEAPTPSCTRTTTKRHGNRWCSRNSTSRCSRTRRGVQQHPARLSVQQTHLVGTRALGGFPLPAMPARRRTGTDQRQFVSAVELTEMRNSGRAAQLHQGESRLWDHQRLQRTKTGSGCVPLRHGAHETTGTRRGEESKAEGDRKELRKNPGMLRG